MTEDELKPLEGGKVVITLVDGTRIKAFLKGVGYQGVTVMAEGKEYPLRFSSIREARRQ